MSLSGTLLWRRQGEWDLSPQQQVRYIADGRYVQYMVTRAGTADKPSWGLYTRREDGTEERCCVSNLLRDVKSYARGMERRAQQQTGTCNLSINDEEVMAT